MLLSSRQRCALPVSFGSRRLSFAVLLLSVALSALGLSARAQAASPLAAALPGAALTLEQAVAGALDSDPWLEGSVYTERALRDEAAAAAALPDPGVSLRAGNFPVDSFDINQEGMTQTSVGITQRFPRGQTRALARQQKQQLAAQQPLLRLDREARVRATVSELWLEVYVAQQSMRLIEDDRSLFEQLVEVAEARYSAALGPARQQDVIGARLELLRLEDRLSVLSQQRDRAQRRLSEWLGAAAALPVTEQLPQLQAVWAMPPVPAPRGSTTVQTQRQDAVANLSADLGADLGADRGTGMALHGDALAARYQAWIARHPALRALTKLTEVAHTEVELARQNYKPEWGLSAQYGYRAEDLAGRERADLFSVGLSFDLPIFSSNRQDKTLSAALARFEAARTEQLLLSRQLIAQLHTRRAELARLDERADLYEQRLLPQLAEQSAAALSAYQSDDGELSALLRARIAELDGRLEALAIAVQRQQRVAAINYLLTQVPAEGTLQTAAP